MNYIDTHTHLHVKIFNTDREAVMNRAKQAKISHMITLGTNLSSSRQALELAVMYPEVFAAVGIHPCEAHLAKEEDYQEIRQLVQKNPEIVAIGETGLDFYWDTQHAEAQYHNLNKMIKLAKELDLPVVIHNRSAHRELQWFFQEEKIFELRGVMHCFSGEMIDVRFYLEMGLYISLTANITYPGFQYDRIIKHIPLNRILIETDAPYIPPVQFRKQRNEPAHVIFVAKKIAQIYGKSIEKIAEITTENAKKLFCLA